MICKKMVLLKNKQVNSFPNKLIIQPSRGWRHINIAEIWQYRELLYFFTWRDIKVRYKQTIVGVLWTIIQPVLTMIVFSIFFGKLAKMPSEDVPYPIFVYIGLLPWTYFSQNLTRSSQSIVANANLIRKIYFPRLIVPISTALAGLTDFLISFGILVLLMIFYNIQPTREMMLFPFLVILTFLCSVGVGFWLAALNAVYRDISYIVPFVVRLGMFLTPVIYPVTFLPEKYRWLLYLNPMTGIIDSFRASILGYKSIPVFGLLISLIITVFFFITGIYFFRRTEKDFADVV